MTNLSELVSNKRREIKTDGYAMSIGEWASMYERRELDIHPEFQRFYRWKPAQKTGLIESILLGIPLPPIFVSQRKDGVWDVVDGLQRLSTIFQFMGLLEDENKKKMPPLVLDGTKYLPSLKGVSWNGSEGLTKSLPKDLQLDIKRSKIGVSIVLKESDEKAKYDLFQRLNTGGSELSPQEVRNCLLVMINKKLFEWLKELPRFPSFVSATSLSDKSLEESYDTELVARFISLSLIDEVKLKTIGDVGDFLTDQITAIAGDKKFKKKLYQDLFEKTFSTLDDVLGDSAFKRYNNQKNRHEGGFLLSLFETVALGVAYNLHKGTLCSPEELSTRVKLLWSTEGFTDYASSGMRASNRLPRLVPIGRSLFAAE